MASILAVEDDAVSSKVLTKLLEKNGHKATAATNIKEALLCLEKEHNFDLIILDNKLKGEFGWEFLEKVRHDSLYREIPVIVYTASSDRNSVMKYLHLGVQQILVKPYNASILEMQTSKAITFDWRRRLIEPVEVVCNRQNCTKKEYLDLLNTAILNVRKKAKLMLHFVDNYKPVQCMQELEMMKNLALKLGLIFLEDNTDEAIKCLNKNNITDAKKLCERFNLLSDLMEDYLASITSVVDEDTPS